MVSGAVGGSGVRMVTPPKTTNIIRSLLILYDEIVAAVVVESKVKLQIHLNPYYRLPSSLSQTKSSVTLNVILAHKYLNYANRA